MDREEAYRNGQRETAYEMIRTALLANAPPSPSTMDKLLEFAKLDDEQLRALNDEVYEIRKEERRKKGREEGREEGRKEGREEMYRAAVKAGASGNALLQLQKAAGLDDQQAKKIRKEVLK